MSSAGQGSERAASGSWRSWRQGKCKITATAARRRGSKARAICVAHCSKHVERVGEVAGRLIGACLYMGVTLASRKQTQIRTIGKLRNSCTLRSRQQQQCTDQSPAYIYTCIYVYTHTTGPPYAVLCQPCPHTNQGRSRYDWFPDTYLLSPCTPIFLLGYPIHQEHAAMRCGQGGELAMKIRLWIANIVFRYPVRTSTCCYI